MKPIIISSVSGGETSVMMTKYIIDKFGDKYDIRPVFINTGHEREKTLEFMKKSDDYFGFKTVWIEAIFPIDKKIYIKESGTWLTPKKFKIVNYETAYRNYLKNGDDPFEKMIEKYGIPNQSYPHCTRELKLRTINSYLRACGLEKGTYKTALGIRSDEPRRLNWERAKKEFIIYFAQIAKITKIDVNEWWQDQPFRLEIKTYEGNCILCFKRSNRKSYTIIQEGLINNDPELIAEIEWLKYIHEKYGRFVPASRIESDNGNPIKMFRGNRDILDLIEESEGFIDFAVDERNLINDVRQLVLWSEELDSNFGCTESCEIF